MWWSRNPLVRSAICTRLLVTPHIRLLHMFLGGGPVLQHRHRCRRRIGPKGQGLHASPRRCCSESTGRPAGPGSLYRDRLGMFQVDRAFGELADPGSRRPGYRRLRDSIYERYWYTDDYTCIRPSLQITHSRSLVEAPAISSPAMWASAATPRPRDRAQAPPSRPRRQTCYPAASPLQRHRLGNVR